MATYFELKEEITEEFIRHVILNSIRDKIVRFRPKYGKVVICADGRSYWRKKVFPHYKKHRKKARDNSEFDWELIYRCLDNLLDDLKAHFPYKVVRVDSAEADDVIAVLATTYDGPHLIVSKDQDFLQLQYIRDVDQWSTSKKDFLKCDDPMMYLKEKIIRGDSGDGIPNILSPANSFADGIRQKPIYSKKLMEWLTQEPEEFCNEEQLQRYRENEKLISLQKIPKEVSAEILEEYEGCEPAGSYHSVIKYLSENKLKQLLRLVDEFVRG